MRASSYTILPQYANETFAHESYGKSVLGSEMTDEDIEFFRQNGYEHAFNKGEAVAEAKNLDLAAPADATDHAGELAKEQKAHKVTTGKLEKEQEAHGKAKDTLKAEKDAHKVTHKELTDTKKLLADAEKQLAEVQGKLDEAQKPADADTK